MIDNKNSIARDYDEIYKKIEIILNSIDNAARGIEYLSNMNIEKIKHNNKYHKLCFNTILDDLTSIKGFIRAYEYILENPEKIGGNT